MSREINSHDETRTAKHYFFRKLKGNVKAICFKRSILDASGQKDTVYLNILKSIFMIDGGYKNRFLQLTETKNEISLFADKITIERFLKCLPDQAHQLMSIEQNNFKVFELYSIEHDLYEPGITCEVTSRLAKEGISCIFTGSFNSSFVIVQEKDFTQATRTLKNLADARIEDAEED